MIADPAPMSMRSAAIFLKRLVQSLPRRVNLDGGIPEMDLDPITIELDLVNPAFAGRHLVD
jgi:hypothetical protein